MLFGEQSTLSQTIETTPMTAYVVSFFLENENGPTNQFLATFDGQTVLSLTDANAFGYTEYSARITVTSNESVLAFAGGSQPIDFRVDDVSVETAPAPAPGTGAISLIGGLTLVGIRRRRQTR